MQITFNTDNTDDLLTVQGMVNQLLGAGTPAAPAPIPDALASIAPEPPVITTPAPEEIASTPVADIPKVTSQTPPPPPTHQGEAIIAEPGAQLDNGALAGDDNFDVTGLPWDGRIHSSGKTKTTKGAWTRRRNLDDSYYAQILAEISAVPQAVQAATETEQVLAETAPPEIPAPADAGFGGNTGEMTWPDVVQVVMKAKVQELVSQEQLDQKAAELGILGGFNNLVSRPDLYARYVMELGI